MYGAAHAVNTPFGNYVVEKDWSEEQRLNGEVVLALWTMKTKKGDMMTFVTLDDRSAHRASGIF